MDAKTDNGPQSTLDDAIWAIRQVKVGKEEHEVRPVGAMVGKRGFEKGGFMRMTRARTDEMKTRTRCMGCGEKGHWFGDNTRCMKLMDD